MRRIDFFYTKDRHSVSFIQISNKINFAKQFILIEHFYFKKFKYYYLNISCVLNF